MLEGRIARLVYSRFRGRLLRGLLMRVVGQTIEELNDPVGGCMVTYNIEGFVDTYDDQYRARAGIPEEHVKISIFAASLPEDVRPVKGDRVVLFRRRVGTHYRVAGPVTTDPAEALWECQAFVIPPEEDES
jgi:hypothetical protein